MSTLLNKLPSLAKSPPSCSAPKVPELDRDVVSHRIPAISWLTANLRSVRPSSRLSNSQYSSLHHIIPLLSHSHHLLDRMAISHSQTSTQLAWCNFMPTCYIYCCLDILIVFLQIRLQWHRYALFCCQSAKLVHVWRTSRPGTWKYATASAITSRSPAERSAGEKPRNPSYTSLQRSSRISTTTLISATITYRWLHTATLHVHHHKTAILFSPCMLPWYMNP